MAKQQSNSLQRTIRESQNRMGFEYNMISQYLGQVGFTKAETDFLSRRSQVAPKEVIKKIEAKMPKNDQGKIIETALLGKVKRCVNNINKLNSKWASATKKLASQSA